MEGQRLFVCDSAVQNQFFSTLSGDGRINCITAPVNLLAGTYRLDIRINAPLLKLKIKNMVQFEVFENDYFKSGLSLKRTNMGVGFFAITSEWTESGERSE